MSEPKPLRPTNMIRAISMKRKISSFRRSCPPSIEILQPLITAYLSLLPAKSPSKSPQIPFQPPSNSGRFGNNLAVEETEGEGAGVMSGDGIEERLGTAMSDALKWCVVKYDMGMLQWIAGLDGEMAIFLDELVPYIRSEDDLPLLHLSIISCAGREYRESMVRAIINRWGIMWPLPNPNFNLTLHASSSRLWSPLHMAAATCSAAVISFLLTHGCKVNWLTDRGLTALDIAEGMQGREDVIALLNGVGEATMLTTPEPADFLFGGEIALEEGRRSLSAPGMGMGNTLQDDLVMTLNSPDISSSSGRFPTSLAVEQELESKQTMVVSPNSKNAQVRRRRIALERIRKRTRETQLKVAAAERQRSEDQHVDKLVQSRLLMLGLTDEQSDLVLRGYDPHPRWLLDTPDRPERAVGNGITTHSMHYYGDMEMELLEENDDDEGDEDDPEHIRRLRAISGMRSPTDGDIFGSGQGGGLADGYYSGREEGGRMGSDREDDTLQQIERELDIDESSVLVFDMTTVQETLNFLISTYRPQCHPVVKRSLPANVIYLMARYTAYRINDGYETFAEFMGLVIETLAMNAESMQTNLPALAFMTYNIGILKYLIHSDPVMVKAPAYQEIEHQLLEVWEDYQLYIIRYMEAACEKIVFESMLDCESLPEDISFADEWAIFRSLTRKRQKTETKPHVAGIFGMVPGSPSASKLAMQPSASTSSIGSSSPDQRKLHSTYGTPSKGGATLIPSASSDGMRSPADIINVLSGTLLVLQAYEVNPGIIVKIYSQFMFWLGGHLFNEMLDEKRKYLSRSKALQIKMNLEILAEWMKSSGLPPALYSTYFQQLLQLLQWLQCLSHLTDLETFVATIPHLHALNPDQMLKAVKDYRYEVNEPRMSEEGFQYIRQLRRSWADELMQKGEDPQSPNRAVRPLSTDSGKPSRFSRIDQLFDGEFGLGDYVPCPPPLNNRYTAQTDHILPMETPSQPYLLAIPRQQVLLDLRAAGPSMASRTPSYASNDEANSMLRSPSQYSFSSRQPMGFTFRSSREVRRVPDDVIEWFAAQRQACSAQSRARRLKMLQGGRAGGPGVSEKPEERAAPAATAAVPVVAEDRQRLDIPSIAKQQARHSLTVQTPSTGSPDDRKRPHSGSALYDRRRLPGEQELGQGPAEESSQQYQEAIPDSPTTPTRKASAGRWWTKNGLGNRHVSDRSQDGSVALSDDAETPLAKTGSPIRAFWGT